MARIKDQNGNWVTVQDSNNTGMTNNTFYDGPDLPDGAWEDGSPNDVLNPEMGLYGALGEEEFKKRGYDKIGQVETEEGGYGKKRVGEQSRGQMNLTGSQGRSILTS
jgi:hypothetical protein|tara:strand:+ start:929 stop:1249 length:321 start_codon:yes stop_codon:yes gene_type:complete